MKPSKKPPGRSFCLSHIRFNAMILYNKDAQMSRKNEEKVEEGAVNCNYKMETIIKIFLFLLYLENFVI